MATFWGCWMSSYCYNLFFPTFISLSTNDSKLEHLCVLKQRGERAEVSSHLWSQMPETTLPSDQVSFIRQGSMQQM